MTERRALVVGGRPLRLADLAPIVRGEPVRAKLAPAAVARIRRSRALVDRVVREGRVVYGVTTGFGALASVRIRPDQTEELQQNLLRSHATGVGPPFPESTARLALFLRIESLAAGFSGVSLGLVETLVEMLNRGVTPVIPEQGSVGASGDLAPLAHLALVVMGEGEATLGTRRMKGGAALARAGIEPVRLQAKEGLALINGTQIMTAIGVECALRAISLAFHADVAGSMSLEALKGSVTPFDPRIQAVRPHPGQKTVADNVRRLLRKSGVLESHRFCSKVQDSYCLRCMPQVHGAVRDTIAHVAEVLEREVRSVTDNPLVFTSDRSGDVLSGGNFHGEPVAIAMDVLGIAVSELGAISERRIESLVNPALSGLPPFLVAEEGLNSGMMITQVVAAALASENKVHAHPASVDSIPTSANKEDHVSMGVTAARKCRTIVDNVTSILAIELLCAAQGLDFLRPLRAGLGVEAAHARLRKDVKRLLRDRVLAPDIEAIRHLIDRGDLVRAADAAVGPLA
ncbi:MAG: histidine ammonia-lyase [Planctomycetes bacterium]|nr:histidine ammonia-lyase [Planctomycetota bacterium]